MDGHRDGTPTRLSREVPVEDLSKLDSDEDGSELRDGEHEKHDKEEQYSEEANTSYSLFSNPPRLRELRQQLFDIKDDLEMSAADFEEYFPFVDNVWRKYKMDSNHDPNSEIFCCRLRPSGQHKSSTPKPAAEGKQQRRKRKREEKTCSMLMKVTYVQDPIRKVRISKFSSSDIAHSHDLEYMDHNKRNSAIMDVARREAVRAFLPGSIFWKMQQEQDRMEDAGGKHMKISDVRNVQYPWRQQNSAAILKAHAGYSQQRTGPRQAKPKTASTPTTPHTSLVQPQRSIQAQQVMQPPPPQLAPTPLPQGTLNYPEHAKEFLYSYLPHVPRITTQARPHITLTWATSLDSRISLAPGLQTAISGPESKAMTHYLRSRHDAILIGVKTAIADDPGLNCRLAGAGGHGGPNGYMQPRPIIIDPHARLHIHPDMRLLRAAREGKARGPWIVVGPHIKLQEQAITTLKAHGGEFLQINEMDPHYGLDWEALFSILFREGIKSIMVEGGGKVLSDLLNPRYTHAIDTIIITIAPTFFGTSGVQVSPDTAFEVRNDVHQPVQTRLTNVRWQPMGASDMILCGHLDKSRAAPRLPGIQEFSRQTPHPDSAPQRHPHDAPPPHLQKPIPPQQPPHPNHVQHYAPPPSQPPQHEYVYGPAGQRPPEHSGVQNKDRPLSPSHLRHEPAHLQGTHHAAPPPTQYVPQHSPRTSAMHPRHAAHYPPSHQPQQNGAPSSQFRHYGPAPTGPPPPPS